MSSSRRSMSLIEPGSVRPELLGEALALLYAGLVARAQAREGS